MKNQTLLKVAGQSILKKKMRTLLTMLGVIIGVAAVSVMAAVGTGAQSQIEEQISHEAHELVIATVTDTALRGEGGEGWIK